jgi:hypothetical protein
MKVACPHCEVVGVVPEDLKYANDWPVACHHCHQHYFVPVVTSPAPLSLLVDLNCSDCGRVAALDKNIHKSVVAGNFPLFCPDCHAPLSAQQNFIVELNQTEIADTRAQQSLGMQSAFVFIFLGFFIVSVSVIAANEGFIGRGWLDNLLLNLPDRAFVSSFMAELLSPNLKNEL